MTTNKNPSKLFILVLMFFLSNPGLLFSQQFKEGHNIIDLDFEVFRDKPENDLLPHLQKNAFDIYNQLSRTIYLLSTIDQLCVDSSFVNDTIYFHGDRNFNYYRRSFTYDSLYKIKIIIAEAYKDSNWLTHQITNVIYNSSGNVVQINYIGYQSVLNDSIIINIEYDSNGSITKEVGEYLDTTSSLFKTAWIKNYNYNEGKLVEFKIRNIKYPNLTQPNFIKFKYNTNSLLIERVEYLLPEKNFIDSVKYLWQFDEENNLIKCYIYYFENSDTSSMYVNNYYYNSYGKLQEEIKLTAYEGDQFTRKDEKMYYYNSTGFPDSIRYMNKIVKGEVDSLDGSGIETYEYHPNGYLTGCTDFYKDKSLWGNKVIIKRDLFENIISVQNEIWHNNVMIKENITKIVYKRKEY